MKKNPVPASENLATEHTASEGAGAPSPLRENLETGNVDALVDGASQNSVLAENLKNCVAVGAPNPCDEKICSRENLSEFSAKNLTIAKQGKTILRDISLDLHFGEIVAIVGKNGAGKSSLLHAMARGNAKKSARELARSRAVLSQKCDCVFDFSVEEFVNFSAETSRERVWEILRELKIAELRSRRISTLSGGEFQKVQFARILAQAAAAGTQNFTFFFDEPTANLDLSTQLEILNLLQNLRSRGAAICVVLHDLRHALRIADRVAILSAGTLAALGPAREILVPANIEKFFSVPATFAGMLE